MERIKIAVIGSRNFANYELFKEKLEYLIQNIKEDIQFVSGGCKNSADELIARYCEENNLPLIEFLPDYNQYGKGATHVRNSRIVEFSDCLIAYWNGSSRGTKSTIDKARKKGIRIKIVEI